MGLTQAQTRAIYAQLTAPSASPAIAFGSPVAFGAGWGEAFTGVGGRTLPEGVQQDVDGSATAGIGIGDPFALVGLEAAVTIISLRQQPGEDGNLNLKLHRALPQRMAVAVGIENTGRWGRAQQGTSSPYVVATKVLDLQPGDPANPLPLSINVGLGGDRFVDPGESGVGPFAALAINFGRRVSWAVDWTGRDVNAAVSGVPFQRIPIVITAGAINLGERLGNEIDFAGGIGYSFRF